MSLENISEMDVAYRVLEKHGKSVYWKDLIAYIIKKKRKSVQSVSAAMSEIYTMLNMDSRFYHEGAGRWGLMEWRPVEVKRRSGRSSSTNSDAVERRKDKLMEDIQEH